MTNKHAQMREMARDLIRDSVIEDAIAQKIAQIIEFIHEDRITPLEAKLAKAVEALNTAANWIDYCAGMMPAPVAKAAIRSWADQTRTIAAELTGDNP